MSVRCGIWVRRGCALIVAGCLALPAMAEDVALVIGNRDHAIGAPVRGADGVVDAADALRDAGVTVLAGQDTDLRTLRELVAQFEQMAGNADRLLVVLAGRFVTGGNDTFFLPVDGDVSGLTGLFAQALPLSSVLQVLGRAPGAGFLVLADDGRDTAQGDFLRDGIGDLTIPQGVSVARGAPGPVAGMIRDVLAVSDMPLTAGEDLSLSGYLPQGHGFLVGDVGDGAALAALRTELAATREQAARAAANARRDIAAAQERADRRIARADATAWTLAQELDTIDGYSLYVETFPDGDNADAALRIIGEIRGEPFRAARLAEEALSLGRDARRAIQRNLTALGFNTRGVDGIFGNGTRTAIRGWQAQEGRAQSGYLDREQIDALAQAVDRAEEQRRAEEERRRQEALRADTAFWRQNGEGRDAQGLRAYLDRFPDGQYAGVARERLARIEAARRAAEDERRAEDRRRADDAYWRELGEGSGEAALRAYLDRYPDGRHAEQARRRLNEIVGEQGDRMERLAWERARSADTVEALERYLAEYPRGVNAAAAYARIAALQTGGGNGDRARAAAEEQALGLNRALRQTVEDRLAALGHDPGQVDGIFDDATRQALRRYQRASGLPVTGYVSQQLVAQLLTDSVLDLLR